VITRYGSPFGEGEVVVANGALLAIRLPRGDRSVCDETAGPEHRSEAPDAAAGDATASSRSVGSEDLAVAARWKEELEAYFRGEKLSWTAEEVDLDHLGLGDFERAVYKMLLTVPAGTTVSYGVLAEMAGYPRAARAVGSAMAHNPIPLVVPCHRVIRADGSLGNYGDDPSLKPRLLEHEAACVAAEAARSACSSDRASATNGGAPG